MIAIPVLWLLCLTIYFAGKAIENINPKGETDGWTPLFFLMAILCIVSIFCFVPISK